MSEAKSEDKSEAFIGTVKNTGELVLIGGIVAAAGYVYYLYKTGKLGGFLANAAIKTVEGVGDTVSDTISGGIKTATKVLFPNRPRMNCAKGIMILNNMLSINPIALADGHYLDRLAADALECSREMLIPQLAYVSTGNARDVSMVTEDSDNIMAHANPKMMALAAASRAFVGPSTDPTLVVQISKKRFKFTYISDFYKTQLDYAVVGAMCALYGVRVPATDTGFVNEVGYKVENQSLTNYMKNALKGINVRKNEELPSFGLFDVRSSYKARYGKIIELPYGGLVVDKPNLVTGRVHRWVYKIKSQDEYHFVSTNWQDQGAAAPGPA